MIALPESTPPVRARAAARVHPNVAKPSSWPNTLTSADPRALRLRSSLLLLALGLFASLAFFAPSATAQGFDRMGVPEWKIDPAFKHDVFTFARVRYTSAASGWGWRRRMERWQTDYPDAELNLAYRLQQMTSLKVNPEPAVVELTQSNLTDYPFLYIVEPGLLLFSDEEVAALRSYLLNGGFLMVDDFWGEAEWENLAGEIKRVFPDREITELSIDHPVFHTVFDLKEKPQVPSIYHALRFRGTGVTWERRDAREVHYRALFDDKGRMMAIFCHNTDLGDGWEREGESQWYFHEFAEKKAYPMAINIIFYAMTH